MSTETKGQNKLRVDNVFVCQNHNNIIEMRKLFILFDINFWNVGFSFTQCQTERCTSSKNLHASFWVILNFYTHTDTHTDIYSTALIHSGRFYDDNKIDTLLFSGVFRLALIFCCSPCYELCWYCLFLRFRRYLVAI